MKLNYSSIYNEVRWMQRERTYYLDSLSDRDFRLVEITTEIIVQEAAKDLLRKLA